MIFPTVDYKIGMPLEAGTMYNGKDGVYRYANNKLYSAVLKVPPTFTGDKLTEQIVSIKLPKIPYDLFVRVHEFFKYIYKLHKSEVAVLLWYNFDSNEWEVEVPRQSVGPGSVDYKRNEQYATQMTEDGFTCVGSIHSHCEMSAFHSGTDDKDEFDFDGVHITIGRVLSGPQFAQRFIVKRIERKFEKISDVVEFPEEFEEHFPNDWTKQVTKFVYQQKQTTYPAKTQRQPSLLKTNHGGGSILEKTVDMQFNQDGSLRIPEIDEETEEFEEEITEEEKRKRADDHYVNSECGYICPLCYCVIPEYNLGKDYTCPECLFPLYADENKYTLETSKDTSGQEVDIAIQLLDEDILE